MIPKRNDVASKGNYPPSNESENLALTNDEAFEKIWNSECEVCGSSPVVRATGLCGPCTFGEADTAGGNW